MDCSPPGSFIHGIFQARVLELGAIAFSSYPLDTRKSPSLPFLRERKKSLKDYCQIFGLSSEAVCAEIKKILSLRLYCSPEPG